MQRRRLLSVGGAVVCVLLTTACVMCADPVTHEGGATDTAVPALKSGPSFADYTGFSAFASAVALPISTVNFTGIAEGTLITMQYAGLDVAFTDGDDTIYLAAAMEEDGAGLKGNGAIGVQFRRSCIAVGARFPGAMTIDIYDQPGGTLLYTSANFAGEGAGHFGGVVSSVPFTYVVIRDWYDSKVYIDDLLFVLGDAWTGSGDMGGGWRYLDWFGSFNVIWVPWIFHAQHGWMYAVGGTPYNLWLYTFDMEWLWTSRSVYPNLYSLNAGAWLMYLRDTTNPRWFYNWSSGVWEAH